MQNLIKVCQFGILLLYRKSLNNEYERISSFSCDSGFN